MKHNIISLSGGKDSTATALVAIAQETENMQFVFADTGNEHQATYDYIDYLRVKLGIEIITVKADFRLDMDRKRKYIEEHWANDGVSDSTIQAAIEVMQPTGNPFLDLCILKGRFPSSKTQFCTVELKVKPIQNLFYDLLDEDTMILSWQGIRAEESLYRSKLNECDEVVSGLYNYRPILRWSVADVFEAHRYFNIQPNPLYKKGMNRVGCMPCINCRKDELKEIGLRFPDQIKRIAEWEAIVSKASKHQSATFFTSDYRGHGIVKIVNWSQTKHGGKIKLEDSDLQVKNCKSSYGLCDGVSA